MLAQEKDNSQDKGKDQAAQKPPAVVIGGASLFGGTGTIFGTLVGTLIISILLVIVVNIWRGPAIAYRVIPSPAARRSLAA